MSFNLFSTKVSVSFLFLATLSLMLLCDKTGYASLMLFAAIIHEMGHFFAMWLCKSKPTEIKLIIGSVQICAPPARMKHEAFILAFGPMANLVIFFVAVLICGISGTKTFPLFALINLLYFCFNALPFLGLDGGSIMLIFISDKLGFSKAQRIMNILTVFAALLIFLIFAVAAIRGTVNYSVCILACYLILSVFLKF